MDILLSTPALDNVNVKQFRKMQIASEIDMKLVYLTPRKGRSGAGLLVEMPEFSVINPNVEGPMATLELSVLCIEVPTINLNAQSGTMIQAEDLAQHVLDTLHLLVIEGMGQLQGVGITPATEFRGAVAYRARVRLMNPRGQTVRSGYVTASFANDACTLTATADEIFYTLDGSFPAKTGNPKSQLYSEPFSVESGDVVRTASYSTNKTISAVKKAIAP